MEKASTTNSGRRGELAWKENAATIFQDPMKEKVWTVMIYMAADNNLEDEAYQDLEEIKKVGSCEQVNILAELDVKKLRVPTRRYYLRQNTPSIEEDVFAELGETNTGEPIYLEEFVRDSVKRCPAKHYLLVIWNHGWGWVNPYAAKLANKRLKSLNIDTAMVRSLTETEKPTISENRIKEVLKSYYDFGSAEKIIVGKPMEWIADDETSGGDGLDNDELKALMAKVKEKIGRKIDILGFDACCMSGVEIAYQLRGTADILIGSEDLEPTKGWPYEAILKHLTGDPKITPRDLSSTVVHKYIESCRRDSVTQSACDLKYADDLAETISEFARRLIIAIAEPRHFEAIKISHKHVQIFDEEEDRFIDLYDFCHLVKKNCIDRGVREICGKLMELIANQFVIETGYRRKSNRHSNGISIYLPPKKIAPGYDDLDFIRDTDWGKFVTAYLAACNPKRAGKSRTFLLDFSEACADRVRRFASRCQKWRVMRDRRARRRRKLDRASLSS